MPLGWTLVEGELDGLPFGSGLLEGELNGMPFGWALALCSFDPFDGVPVGWTVVGCAVAELGAFVEITGSWHST
jgi:hypothetical protein